MKWAALIAWLITALFGFTMLAIWLRNGGMRQRGGGGKITPPLILSHFLLAAGGLVVWIVYLAVDKDVVERAVSMIDRAEYKRRQAPPGVKLRPKAFGRDRRTPITNRWRG